MRTVPSSNGYSIIVSNQEYRLLRNISARGKVDPSTLEEFYQELAEKLHSRGVLNKTQIDGVEYFTPVTKEL